MYLGTSRDRRQCTRFHCCTDCSRRDSCGRIGRWCQRYPYSNDRGKSPRTWNSQSNSTWAG